MAEPASIVKRRRFCRRTSLHFIRGMQKPVQPVAVEINFSPPSAMCGVGQRSPRRTRIVIFEYSRGSCLHVWGLWKNTKAQTAENGLVWGRCLGVPAGATKPTFLPHNFPASFSGLPGPDRGLPGASRNLPVAFWPLRPLGGPLGGPWKACRKVLKNSNSPCRLDRDRHGPAS